MSVSVGPLDVGQATGLWRCGPDAVLAVAPAKLNLFLEIHGKRADGYHALESLMVAIDLLDTLEVRDDPVGTLSLTCSDPRLPTDGRNLVYRAAERLRDRHAPGRGARMHLVKRIPAEAGLGGGSSDAIAVLRSLRQVWQLDVDDQALGAIAAELGSDLNFFLSAPAGWCTGRGEVVTAERIGRPLHCVVVKPTLGLGTAEVYRRVVVPEVPLSGNQARQALRDGDLEALGRCLHNRLQGPAFAVAPGVAHVCKTMAELDVLGCQLSGSGSAVFALCRDRPTAERVAREVRVRDVGKEFLSHVFVVRSWP